MIPRKPAGTRTITSVVRSHGVRGVFAWFALPAATVAASLVATTAQAAPTVMIQEIETGLCLDVPRASRSPETPLIVYDCNGGDNQAWTRTALGELKVYDGRTCLDVRGAKTMEPAVAQIYPCHGRSNQRWEVVRQPQTYSDGSAEIRSVASIRPGQPPLCLTVLGNGQTVSPRNGDRVELRICRGGAGSRWLISEPSE